MTQAQDGDGAQAAEVIGNGLGRRMLSRATAALSTAGLARAAAAPPILQPGHGKVNGA